MKILYLVTKSEVGGAQTHIYQLSKYFIEKGNEVAIMSYPGGWLETQINADIKQNNAEGDSSRYRRNSAYIKFYPNRYFSNVPDPIRIFKAIREIKRMVKDFKPDLIGCHSTAAGFLSRVAIRNKIPTTFTAHGWAFTKGTPFLRKCLAILIEKIAGKFCSKIICVSDFDRNLALKYKIAPKEKIITIHNGVESQYFEHLEHSNIQIVFIGRLAQPKDPLLLLKSFNGLSSELKNKAQISIIGEGPKRKELEKFIKENELKEKIKLLESISREKVFEVLRKSDIFVLISNWEGFPYTIIEAMSFGLAIIASDVGGIKEALNDNCGILVKRGDGKEIENALEKLIKTPSLIKEMGERASEKAKKEFSLNKMLKETEKIYKTIILF